MKRYELVEVAKLLRQNRKIYSIFRVDDNIIKLNLNDELYINLTKGSSTCFMCDNFLRQKIYNAPFDRLLSKYFCKSEILSVEVEKSNRIMKIRAKNSLSYKEIISTLVLEFTGRNTNAIIIDENNIILEALRHIDKNVSFRQIKVGIALMPLEPINLNENEQIIPDIKKYLHEIYLKRQEQFLNLAKNEKINKTKNNLQNLQNELAKLPSKDELMQKADFFANDAQLILANINEIKAYQSKIDLIDFEGNKRTIELPKDMQSPSHGANLLFNQAKKLKQKAKSINIQKENLLEKIDFQTRLLHMLNLAQTLEELEILLPKQKRRTKQKEKKAYEIFYFEGYKICVGKSSKSNQALFRDAKNSDIWFHIQGIPSAHVIIKSDKQNIAKHVLYFAAKLCVNFSIKQNGRYIVDYTKWKYVKIQNGSNVLYTDFSSILINT